MLNFLLDSQDHSLDAERKPISCNARKGTKEFSRLCVIMRSPSKPATLLLDILRDGKAIFSAYSLVGFPHGLKHVGHFLPLPLCPDVRADPFLEELETPLILVDPEQLHGAPLVGRKAGHFSNQISDELVAGGELALGCGRALLERVRGGLVAFLQTDADLVPRSHRDGVEENRKRKFQLTAGPGPHRQRQQQQRKQQLMRMRSSAIKFRQTDAVLR